MNNRITTVYLNALTFGQRDAVTRMAEAAITAVENVRGEVSKRSGDMPLTQLSLMIAAACITEVDVGGRRGLSRDASIALIMLRSFHSAIANAANTVQTIGGVPAPRLILIEQTVSDLISDITGEKNDANQSF